MFGTIKIVFVALLISAIAGAGLYVMKLRSDNAILKANQIELERRIQRIIRTAKKDFEEPQPK